MQRDRKGDFWIKVKLTDPMVADFYESLPKRSKSIAITEVIALGIPVYSENLDILKGIIRELIGRVNDLENVNTTLQIAIIGCNSRIETIDNLLTPHT